MNDETEYTASSFFCPICDQNLIQVTEIVKTGEHGQHQYERSYYACDHCEQTFTCAEIQDD